MTKLLPQIPEAHRDPGLVRVVHQSRLNSFQRGDRPGRPRSINLLYSLVSQGSRGEELLVAQRLLLIVRLYGNSVYITILQPRGQLAG